MQSSEQIEELKSCLLNCLDSFEDFWVSSWLESVLNFVHLNLARVIDINFFKSLLHSLKSNLIQWLIQVPKEHLIIDLTLFHEIVDTKEHFKLTRVHISNFHIIKGLQPLIQIEPTSILTINDFELPLERNVAADTPGRNGSPQLLQQQILLRVVALLAWLSLPEILLLLCLHTVLLIRLIIIVQVEVIR